MCGHSCRSRRNNRGGFGPPLIGFLMAKRAEREAEKQFLSNQANFQTRGVIQTQSQPQTQMAQPQYYHNEPYNARDMNVNTTRNLNLATVARESMATPPAYADIPQQQGQKNDQIPPMQGEKGTWVWMPAEKSNASV